MARQDGGHALSGSQLFRKTEESNWAVDFDLLANQL
jgi:hypothetical protein